MHYKEEFTAYALRLLITIISVIIMLPIIYERSLYVTAMIFALGQFIDGVAKIRLSRSKSLFIFYVIGIFIGITIIGMCMLPLSNITEFSFSFYYNLILIGLNFFYCIVNVYEFIRYILRIYYTKKLLRHF